MPALEIVRAGSDGHAIPWMLERAVASARAVLAVWRDAQPAAVLGRFHATVPGTPVGRRRTGGRIVPTGPGVVRLALALPHRSALESEDPRALRPEQAMNRCVRGLLDACRGLGIDVLYPGRDLVTAGRAPVGWLSLTEEEGGGALFEAGLAVTTALSDLPALPPGLVRPDYGPGPPRTLVAPGGNGLEPATAAEALVSAYASRASAVDDVAVSPAATEAGAALEWAIPPLADRVGEVPTLLGRLRAHVGVDASHRIAAIRLSGDVIAPTATVRRVEDALHGVPALRSEIERAAAMALEHPAAWMLGVGGGADVAAAIMEALA